MNSILNSRNDGNDILTFPRLGVYTWDEDGGVTHTKVILISSIDKRDDDYDRAVGTVVFNSDCDSQDVGYYSTSWYLDELDMSADVSITLES
jgi:hypothetical protein